MYISFLHIFDSDYLDDNISMVSLKTKFFVVVVELWMPFFFHKKNTSTIVFFFVCFFRECWKRWREFPFIQWKKNLQKQGCELWRGWSRNKFNFYFKARLYLLALLLILCWKYFKIWFSLLFPIWQRQSNFQSHSILFSWGLMSVSNCYCLLPNHEDEILSGLVFSGSMKVEYIQIPFIAIRENDCHSHIIAVISPSELTMMRPWTPFWAWILLRVSSTSAWATTTSTEEVNIAFKRTLIKPAQHLEPFQLMLRQNFDLPPGYNLLVLLSILLTPPLALKIHCNYLFCPI